MVKGRLSIESLPFIFIGFPYYLGMDVMQLNTRSLSKTEVANLTLHEVKCYGSLQTFLQISSFKGCKRQPLFELNVRTDATVNSAGVTLLPVQVEMALVCGDHLWETEDLYESYLMSKSDHNH